MQGSSQEGMVLFGISSLFSPAFINVKHLDVGWANSGFANTCVALLCWLVFKLFMCLFVQHDSSGCMC